MRSNSGQCTRERLCSKQGTRHATYTTRSTAVHLSLHSNMVHTVTDTDTPSHQPNPASLTATLIVHSSNVLVTTLDFYLLNSLLVSLLFAL